MIKYKYANNEMTRYKIGGNVTRVTCGANIIMKQQIFIHTLQHDQERNKLIDSSLKSCLFGLAQCSFGQQKKKVGKGFGHGPLSKVLTLPLDSQRSPS